MNLIIALLALSVFTSLCASVEFKDRQNSLHQPISDDEFYRFFPQPVARLGDEELCQPRLTDTPSNICPEEPRPISELDKVINECSAISGCSISLTDDMKIICSFNANKAGKVQTICPGQKIVFDRPNLWTPLHYLIDLRADPLRTDVYILIDATGAMYTAIKTLRRRLRELLDLFKSTNEGTAFALGYYRDERDPNNGFQHLQGMTMDYSKIETAASGLRAHGGADWAEANLVGLYKVATDGNIGWRQNSRRFILHIGDVVGHEPSCVPGISKTLTRSVVANELQQQRISVLAINFQDMNKAPFPFGCKDVPRNTRGAEGQADFITSRTNGAIVSNPDQTKMVELTKHLIRNRPRTFDVDYFDCLSKLTSSHNPTFPLQVLLGDDSIVGNTLKLQPGACKNSGNFKCRIRYLENGADLKPTEIEFTRINGCV